MIGALSLFENLFRYPRRVSAMFLAFLPRGLVLLSMASVYEWFVSQFDLASSRFFCVSLDSGERFSRRRNEATEYCAVLGR